MKTNGFSLLETMIALTVLAIGLLGQARTQMDTITTNQSSYYKLQAAYLANEIVDRLRLNPVGVSAGDYNDASTAMVYVDNNCKTSSNGCSVTEVSQVDLYEWMDHVRASIPNGSATLVRQTEFTEQAVFVITINWNTKITYLADSNKATYNKFNMQVGI